MTTYLTQILFGATLLLLVGIVAGLLFCSAAASLRCRIWTFTLFGLLLLPILSPLLPTTHRVPVIDGDNVVFDASWDGDTVAGSQGENSFGGEQQPVERESIPSVPPAAPKIGTITLYSPIMLWLFGSAVLLLHLILSIHSVRKMLAPLENLTDPLLDELRRELGIAKPVRLVRGEVGTVPFITGIVRPTIVLPPQSQDWQEPERRAVLTHELAHVARNDLFWQWMTQIVCAVYWFHPLVWFAAYRIGIERESACDDTVVLRGEKPSIYADLLLELANGFRKQRIGLLGCTMAITRRNKIGKRIQAVLNPNLCRAPLGKIGTVLFGILALGVLLLTATTSPFANRTGAEETDDEIALAKIAVKEDAPKVTIRGKVLNPDGIPASRVWVECKTVAFYERFPNVISGDPPASWEPKPYYAPRFSGISSSGTDKEGNFVFDKEVHQFGAQVGANVILFVSMSNALNAPRNLVSEPVIFIAKADQEDEEIVIQLREGIPVSGTAMFEDGIPAAGKTIVGVRPIIPPSWVKSKNDMILNQGNQPNFALEFQATVQADGQYELFLPPGDFLIQKTGDGGGRIGTSISIKDPLKDKDAPKVHRVDLEFPAPLRGKFVKEDGSEPGTIKVHYVSASEKEHSTFSLSTTLRTSEFAFDKREGCSLAALTEDGSLGAIYPVSDDKLTKFHTIVLRPTATVKLELRDAAGLPMVEKRVDAGIVSWVKYSSSAGHISLPSVMDESGVAEFRLPSGTGLYRFRWEGGELERRLTLQPGETVVLSQRAGDGT